MQVVLVRHGQTDWNREGRFQGRTDIPLNDVGRSEASLARDHLGLQSWDCIVSSPLSRARETATIINEKINRNIIVMEEFIEQCFGEAEGLLYHEIETNYGHVMNIPNRESSESIGNRILLGMEKVLQLPYKKVIIVAHAVAINKMLCIIEHGLLKETYYTLNNCGVTHISYRNNQWKIERVNEISHLDMKVNEYNEKLKTIISQ